MNESQTSPAEHRRCLVAGCVNHTDEGQFVGELCRPCYEYLKAGEIGPATNFIRALSDAVAVHLLGCKSCGGRGKFFDSTRGWMRCPVCSPLRDEWKKSRPKHEI